MLNNYFYSPHYLITKQPSCLSMYVIKDICQTFPDFWNVGNFIHANCCYGNVKGVMVTLYIMDAPEVT